MDSKPTLLIIRGAPGAGKSTIARALINSVLFDAYVEADSYFMRDGKYEFSISHIGEAHDYCFNEAKELAFKELAEKHDAERVALGQVWQEKQDNNYTI